MSWLASIYDIKKRGALIRPLTEKANGGKMKKLGLILLGSVVLAGCGDKQEVKLESDDQKASYAIGFKTGEQMQGRMGEELGMDVDAFLAGMGDGMRGGEERQFSDEELEEILTAFQERKMEEQQAAMEQELAENEAKGAKYREENAARDEVTETESGLQYEVLTAGEEGAASPAAEDTVKVHYHGTLIDGTVFDSSVDRGEPATFPLGGIIKGWQEALPMMKVGDKWRIVLPPALAYGEAGAGSMIGPNETLVFEVELLEVVKAGE